MSVDIKEVTVCLEISEESSEGMEITTLSALGWQVAITNSSLEDDDAKPSQDMKLIVMN